MAPLHRNMMSADRLPGQYALSWELENSRKISAEVSHVTDEGVLDFDMADDDEMDVTPPAQIPQPMDIHDALYPLQEAANRVSHQVEEFAKNLDQFNPKLGLSPQEKRQRAKVLVVHYCDAAETVLAPLQKCVAAQQKGLSERSKNDNDDSEEEGKHGVDPEVMEELERCQSELHTWKLLQLLLNLDEYQAPIEKPKVHRYTTEAEIWTQFLARDKIARERQMILKWLEDTATDTREDVDTVVDQLEAGSERQGLWTNGWLFTKEAIKGQKRLRCWQQPLEPDSPGLLNSLVNATKTAPLATQLDPDAASRQQHTLEAQDQYFEKAVWLGCWEMLRRGNSWKEVRAWCQERVEGWRAISIRPSYRGLHLPTELLIEEEPGPAVNYRSRAIWRNACLRAAREGNFDDYENAVYGLLSGDFASVEKVSRCWDDLLYAYYNSLVLTRFDAYLQATYPDRFSALLQGDASMSMTTLPIDPRTSANQIVQKISSHRIAQEEAKQDRFKMIHSALIGSSFEKFAHIQGLLVSREANVLSKSNIIPNLTKYISEDMNDIANVAEDPQTLRIMTHILILHQIIYPRKLNKIYTLTFDNIIVAYLQFLKVSQKVELIPLYASFLDEQRMHIVLGRILIDVTDVDERDMLIKLMNRFSIDVQLVLNMLIRLHDSDLVKEGNGETETRVKVEVLERPANNLHAMPKIKSNFIGMDISEDDEVFIRAFQWHLSLDGYWEQTMKIGSLVYRKFLISGRLAAARKFSDRAPLSLVSNIKTKFILGRSLNLIKEMEGLEDEDLQKLQEPEPSDVDPVGKYTLWKQAKTFYELESLVKALSALEAWKDIEDVVGGSSSRIERSLKERQQRGLQEVVQTVEPLLGSWLDQPKNQNEASDFKFIRNAYLPSIIIAYISVLYSAGLTLSQTHFLYALRLSSRIAAPNSKVTNCFVESKMMTDLVNVLAIVNKSVIKADEVGKRASSSQVRRRTRHGERMDIWSVKPAGDE